MIAQQCCADSTLKHEYDILNTVAFGSPSIGFSLSGLINLKEGTCVRLGDTKDIVPYLSVNTLNLGIFAQIFGLKKENGGYSSMQSVKAHCCSYQREDVWGNYDVLGEKNGKSSITLNFATTRWYQTPFK